MNDQSQLLNDNLTNDQTKFMNANLTNYPSKLTSDSFLNDQYKFLNDNLMNDQSQLANDNLSNDQTKFINANLTNYPSKLTSDSFLNDQYKFLNDNLTNEHVYLEFSVVVGRLQMDGQYSALPDSIPYSSRDSVARFSISVFSSIDPVWVPGQQAGIFSIFVAIWPHYWNFFKSPRGLSCHDV